MSTKHKIFVIFLFLLVLTNCTNRPDGVLPRSKMQKVLIDLHKADGIIYAAGYSYGHEEVSNKYYQSVLAAYNVTQAEFDSSLVWYSRNPKILEKIYIKVTDKLQTEYDLLTENKDCTESVDTAMVRPAILDLMQFDILKETDEFQRIIMQMLLGEASCENIFNKELPLRGIYKIDLQDSIFSTLLNDTVSAKNLPVTFIIQSNEETSPSDRLGNQYKMIESQDAR